MNQQSPGFWDRVKSAPLWVKIVLGVFLFIVVVSVAVPAPEDEDEGGDGDGATTQAVAPKQEPTQPKAPAEPAPAPPAAPQGPTKDDIESALDDADPTNYLAFDDSLDVKEVEVLPAVVNITLGTPEGGFDGPSTDDLDGSAAATFEATYNDADWQKNAYAEFIGGLVDSKTGNDLPNAQTASYAVTAREGKQINWDEAPNIDWSLYRQFLHPAFED